MQNDEMYKEPDLRAQITRWYERAKGLEEWKARHDYNHPDWEQNSRDLNNAYVKIKQLKDRKNRKSGTAVETFSIPKLN